MYDKRLAKTIIYMISKIGMLKKRPYNNYLLKNQTAVILVGSFALTIF